MFMSAIGFDRFLHCNFLASVFTMGTITFWSKPWARVFTLWDAIPRRKRTIVLIVAYFCLCIHNQDDVLSIHMIMCMLLLTELVYYIVMWIDICIYITLFRLKASIIYYINLSQYSVWIINQDMSFKEVWHTSASVRVLGINRIK